MRPTSSILQGVNFSLRSSGCCKSSFRVKHRRDVDVRENYFILFLMGSAQIDILGAVLIIMWRVSISATCPTKKHSHLPRWVVKVAVENRLRVVSWHWLHDIKKGSVCLYLIRLNPDQRCVLRHQRRRKGFTRKRETLVNDKDRDKCMYLVIRSDF